MNASFYLFCKKKKDSKPINIFNFHSLYRVMNSLKLLHVKIVSKNRSYSGMCPVLEFFVLSGLALLSWMYIENASVVLVMLLKDQIVVVIVKINDYSKGSDVNS